MLQTPNCLRYFYLFGVAFRLLRLKFLRKTDDHALARKMIAQRLGQGGGIAMKIGQVIADVGQSTEMRTLLESQTARPLKEMMPVLEQALEGHVDQVFKTISEQASAASLGQVHRAELHTGEIVAIKIQYPFVEPAVRAELKLAGLIPGLGPVKKWGIDLNAYRRELADNMDRELDYLSESQRQHRMRQSISVDGLVIPSIYSEYCSQRVLVQGWETGELLDQILDWPPVDRMLVGRTLLLTLFKSLFEVGEVHGDPHMGNTFYRYGESGKPEVVLLDFGCTIQVSPLARQALLKMIIETREKSASAEQVLQSFVALGFDPDKLIHIVDQLPLLAQVLFKPFLSDEPFETQSWKIKPLFEQLLGDNRWWFRSAGPADLFLIMRAFQGVVRQLNRLDVSLPWWPLLVKGLSEDALKEARAVKLPDLPENIEQKALSTPAISSSLKIKIEYTGDKRPVEISLPALAALELEQVIPDDVLALIDKTEDIDLDLIEKQLIDTRLAPGVLFTFQKSGTTYWVWLE
ncbi:MAG: AarF/UbiB family protein, partial [Gammaproteobacteria bacterium]|nr:AarF/UbiB family protein [Gammaproteobacteria bacterium]